MTSPGMVYAKIAVCPACAALVLDKTFSVHAASHGQPQLRPERGLMPLVWPLGNWPDGVKEL